ncbi:MAG: DUF308 domain-containing protein [Thermoleophilia bacterium]|nr:DUF308 domain-containing protein [Thermoleophilia bacterium]
MNDIARADDSARQLAGRVWYAYLIAGLISIVFGIIVLSNIFAGLAALVWLTGFYLLYAGIIDLTSASVIRPRWLSALIGILAIAGGIAALAWPGATLRVLAWVLGVSFIAWGVARLLLALRFRGEGWVWQLAAGAAIAVVGAIALVYPGLTVFALAVMLGINALIWGVFAIFEAFALRGMSRGESGSGGLRPAI